MSPLAFDLLGEPARLADPAALRLLLAPLALGGLAAWRLRGRRAALRATAGALAGRVAPTAGGARPAARLGLWLVALALLAVALARPQCGGRTELAPRSGVDAIIALDVSRSMLAQDVAPDRISRARLELTALLARSGGDRFGLVLFARHPLSACPLTRDTAAVATLLRAARPEGVPDVDQGTDLGAALRAARDLLASAEHGARGKVVLLVTDGEDQAGGAVAAARELAGLDIRVHVLAAGRSAGAPIPQVEASGVGAGYKRDRHGAPVLTRRDDALLTELAARGNGEVFDVARADRGILAVRGALDGLARAELTDRLVVVWEERYAWFAFPALLALLGALLLREARGGASSPPSPSPSPRPTRSDLLQSGEPPEPGPGLGVRTAPGNARLALIAAGALALSGAAPAEPPGPSILRAEEPSVREGNERLLGGDPGAALLRYEAAERAVGPRPEIDLDRGNALYRAGRLDEARAAWARAAGRGAAALASRAQQNTGTALAAAGDRDGAIAALTQALRLDPGNEDARVNLELLLRRREAERARSEAQQQQQQQGARQGHPPATPPGEPARPATGADAAARREDAGRPSPPMRRAEAERLLDALRGRERPMPLPGNDDRPQGEPDADRDW